MQVHVYSKQAHAVDAVQAILVSMQDDELVDVTDDTCWKPICKPRIGRAETYWQELTNGNVPLTTLLLNKRLRALGWQGQADEAEALLHQQLESDDAKLVNAKSWVQVMRPHANGMGRNTSDIDNQAHFVRLQALVRDLTQRGFEPATDAYNALLRCMVQLTDLPDKAKKAESVLSGLVDKYKQNPANADNVRLNADTFFHVYQANRGEHYPKVETLWQLQTGFVVILRPSC